MLRRWWQQSRHFKVVIYVKVTCTGKLAKTVTVEKRLGGRLLPEFFTADKHHPTRCRLVSFQQPKMYVTAARGYCPIERHPAVVGVNV